MVLLEKTLAIYVHVEKKNVSFKARLSDKTFICHVLFLSLDAVASGVLSSIQHV